MLLGYSPDYVLTFAIGGSASGSAFLEPDDGSALADGRTGVVNTMQWIGGTQNTSSYVEITVTISSATDATAIQGIVGVANVDLPEGTKLVIGGVTQRLVANERGEMGAWALPMTTGNSLVIRIYNDVNGVASIAANHEFSIGEIFVGRVINLCTLVGGNPSADLTDPTAFNRSAGGQLWQNMRKPYRVVSTPIGTFSTADAKGGNASSVDDGASGTIDIQRLRAILSTTAVCAVCDTPNEGLGQGTLSMSGIRYDQDVMQVNWMLARPTNPGTLAMTKPPRWTWGPQFQEAI